MRKVSRAKRTSLKRIFSGGTVLALIALFGLPTAAFAVGPTTVDVSGTTLTATASDGERNSITVGNAGPTVGGGISIKDTGPAGPGTTLTAGATAAGCVQATADEVRCPLGDLTAAVVNAGDLKDVVFVLNDDVIVTVNGGAGDDDLRGGPGNDILNGDAGNDVLRGGNGSDVLDGGTNDPLPNGGDTVDYGASSAGVTVTLDGNANDGKVGEGDNVLNVEIVEGSSHNDVITAGAADAILRGNNGNDDLNGGDGNDTLVGGNGADDMDGGAGTDTVDYENDSSDLTITLDNNANDGAVGEGDNVRDTNEIIIGGVGDDNITGTTGSQTLNGGGGNDILNGDVGTDTIIGGPGVDTVSYEGRNVPVNVSLDGVANDGAAGENDNVTASVENVIGGNDNDTITGSDGRNRLDGGPGADTIGGGGGNDTIVGRVGQGDVYTGGAGTDTVTFASHAGPGGVNVRLDGTTSNATTISGVEKAIGSDFDDTIVGNASRNTLNGGFGNDTLEGLDGNDTLNGGPGDDTLLGGPDNDALNGGPGPGVDPVLGAFTDADVLNGQIGVDTVSYSTRTANVFLSLDGVANDGEAGEGDNIGDTVEKVTGGKGNDTITGNANKNTLTGGPGNDTINGRGSADTISGQGGDDDLTGGPGKDGLSGGPGDDVFHTADGVKDSINCGTGNDNVTDTDAIDAKSSNCFP